MLLGNIFAVLKLASVPKKKSLNHWRRKFPGGSWEAFGGRWEVGQFALMVQCDLGEGSASTASP